MLVDSEDGFGDPEAPLTRAINIVRTTASRTPDVEIYIDIISAGVIIIIMTSGKKF